MLLNLCQIIEAVLLLLIYTKHMEKTKGRVQKRFQILDKTQLRGHSILGFLDCPLKFTQPCCLATKLTVLLVNIFVGCDTLFR